MSAAQWRELWTRLSEGQRERIRAKAQWEHMSLLAVIREWWPELERRPMLDALGKECDKLEEDREYNAGLVLERERELKEEGRSGDRREAEMAEQRDLAYAKYDEAQRDALRLKAEVERLREALEREHSGNVDGCPGCAALTSRPEPENTP